MNPLPDQLPVNQSAALPPATSYPSPSVVRRRLLRRRLRVLHPAYWAPFAVMLVVLGLLWRLGAHRWPYLLPPLSDVGSELAGDPGFFLHNAWVTLREALLGLGIAFVCAFVIAVAVSELALARRAIMPVAVVLNVTPLVAIAPALVVAFGFGMVPKLVVTALICFFPILINTAVGLRSVPAPVLQVYRSIHASRWEMLRHLRIPGAMPYVFASLQIVLPLSVIGAVVAELNAAGSADGLGTTIQVASGRNNLDLVWAAILVLAVMGAVLLLAITVVQRRVLHWHDSHQSR
ncbi:ABC transporter permease [Nocardioides sp. DS6]|uniref:ABC transporter permease n=1 Tax=Nocardioides eburneus TaxID=3231482 RepID=A0ABV3SXI1_9ACTN